MSVTTAYKRHRDAILGGVLDGTPRWLVDAQERAKRQLEEANANLPPGVAQTGFRVQTGEEPLEVFIMGSGKHGKSTLINSLMGRYVAPVDVLSKTWCFHRFIAVPHPDSAVSIYMRDVAASPLYSHLLPKLGKPVAKPNPVLYEYQVDSDLATTILDDEERRRNEEDNYCSPILEVEWQVPSADSVLPGLRLVDTQGIDQLLTDMNHQVHLEWRYSRADAVIWIVSYENLGDRVCLKKMVDLRRYARPMIILINRWDEVSDKERVLRRAESIYGGLAQFVLPICALQAFLGSTHAGYTLTKQDEFFLKQYRREHSDRLREASGLPELEDAFRRLLTAKASLQRNIQLYGTVRLAQRDYRRELSIRQEGIAALLDMHEKCMGLLRQLDADTKRAISALSSAAAQQAKNTLASRIDDVTYKTSESMDGSTLQFASVAEALVAEIRNVAADSLRRIQDFVNEVRHHRKQIGADAGLELPDLIAKTKKTDFSVAPDKPRFDASYNVSPAKLQQIENELNGGIFSPIQWLKKTFGGWTSTEHEVNCAKRSAIQSRCNSSITSFTQKWQSQISELAAGVIAEFQQSVELVMQQSGGTSALKSEHDRIERSLSWVAVPSPFAAIPMEMMKQLNWHTRGTGRQSQKTAVKDAKRRNPDRHSSFSDEERSVRIRGDDHELTIDLSENEARYGCSVSISGPHATISVAVPPNVKDGQRLRCKGQGFPGKYGGKPGDLFATVSITTDRSQVSSRPNDRQKVACTRCGAMILPSTARKTAGLCMPCAQGRR